MIEPTMIKMRPRSAEHPREPKAEFERAPSKRDAAGRLTPGREVGKESPTTLRGPRGEARLPATGHKK